jgi:hypothetical protein
MTNITSFNFALSLKNLNEVNITPVIFPDKTEVQKTVVLGEEPRWRRSRTGRTLSPPQIHQKSI